MPGRAGTALGRGVGAGVEARARLLGLARATRGARRGGDLRVLHGGCRRWLSRGRLVFTAEGSTGAPPPRLARAPRLYRPRTPRPRAGASYLRVSDSVRSRGRAEGRYGADDDDRGPRDPAAAAAAARAGASPLVRGTRDPPAPGPAARRGRAGPGPQLALRAHPPLPRGPRGGAASWPREI